MKLPDAQWCMAYHQSDYDFANQLLSSMLQQQAPYGISISKEPVWAEVNKSTSQDFIKAIDDACNADVKVVVVLLQDPKHKKAIKKHLDQRGTPSQFLLARTLKNAQPSVFSNLLKQMNTKLRGDLYQVKYAQAFKNTMVVGVDVIMSGRSKLIGCSSTTSGRVTQCHTRLYVQEPCKVTEDEIKQGKTEGKKKRELLEMKTTLARADIIRDFIGKAMMAYKKETKTLPDQVVIFRDGMGGPAMEKLVRDVEAPFISDFLEGSQAGYKPKIVFCMVDRNVQHRVFAQDHTGALLNPGPGSVIDTALVEKQGSSIYDFYLIPHKATVATAQPVLFKVCYNTSSITKE